MLEKIEIKILESLQRITRYALGRMPVKINTIDHEYPIADEKINEIMNSDFGFDMDPRTASILAQDGRVDGNRNWANNVFTRGPVYRDEMSDAIL